MKRLVGPERQISKNNQRQQHHQKQSPQHRRRPRRLTHFITKGVTVEVSTKEEGFHGAWFTATVVKGRKRSTDKVYVEYKTLLRDEDPTKPLREYVKPDLIRPEPPLQDQHRETFDVGDAVDAFHEDGWWTGTVTEVKEDSKFLVFFEKPPHHIEFDISVLRFHRDWVKGAWVPPVNLQIAAEEMMSFCKEKRVEVSFDGASPDVWFPATVLEDKCNDAFLVECEQSDGNGGSYIRKETVNSLHIRPNPPFSYLKSFFLLEKVDAFYDFGWWSGVITKESTDSRYLVNINHTKNDREFAISELRPHMEWKEGDWFTESQDALIPLYLKNNENSFEKNDNNIEMAPSHTNPVSKKTSSQEKTTISSTSMEKNIELAIPGNDTPVVVYSSTRGSEKSSRVSRPDFVSVESDILRADLAHDNHSSRKRVATMRSRNAEKEESALISPGNSRENKAQVNKLQDSAAGGKEGNEAENAPGDCLTGDTNLPVVLGLACDNTKTPGSKRSYRPNGESSAKRGRSWSNFDEAKLHSVKVTNGLEAVDVSEKRKRGRPRKSISQAPIPSMDDVNVAASEEASTFGQVLPINGSSGAGLANDHMKQENRLGSIKSTTSPSSTGGENAVEAIKKATSSTGGESAEQASRKPREKLPTKRGKKRTTNLNVISKVHDVTSPKSVEGNTVGETDMNEEDSNEESPADASDNQPLAKWLGILHSPTRFDSSRSSLMRCNADATSEHMEVVEEGSAAIAIRERMEVVEEGTANAGATLDVIVRPTGLELSNLPFVKKSMLWSALESMEIFQKLPQKPHFLPLEHVKETVREGLAIGSMVTFTGVVEKTSKLQFDDPKESIDAILETLLELETYGFDVGAIREHVIRLGQTKEKQEKLEEEVEKLNSEISEQEAEKSEIDKEIEEINRKISELQEKQSGMIVMKKKKTGEIESLQVKLKGVEEGISSIRSEFEGHGSWP